MVLMGKGCMGWVTAGVYEGYRRAGLGRLEVGLPHTLSHVVWGVGEPRKGLCCSGHLVLRGSICGNRGTRGTCQAGLGLCEGEIIQGWM